MASQSLLSRGGSPGWGRSLLTIAVLLIVGSTFLWAHEDPLGDIHPEVTLKDGRFMVRARNNTKFESHHDSPLCRIFDADGNLLLEKRGAIAIEVLLPFHESSFKDRIPKDHEGLERPMEGDGVMIVPEWKRQHGGSPFVIEYRNNTFTYHRLTWKVPDVYGVEDVLIAGDFLYLLATREYPRDQIRLSLHKFSLKDSTEEASVELPTPCTIYSFPVCSNLIEHKGVVYLGIVEEEFRGYRLTWVGWNGKSPTISKRNLTNEIDWNTSLSVAGNGDKALIAYHYPGDFPGLRFFRSGPDSKIRTIPIDLK